MKSEVILSDDKQHRLLLKHVWNKEKPMACVITIHPTLDNALQMDDTTKLIVNGILNLESFGGVSIVNLFTLLTPKLQLRWARDIDINDLENDNYIKKAANEASIVLIAWGRGVEQNIRLKNRADQVISLLSDQKEKLKVISDGERSGIHPLTPSARKITWILEDADLTQKDESK
jgi:hypothetical protein